MKFRPSFGVFLSLGITSSLVSVLVKGRHETPVAPAEQGIVWVYHSEVCPVAGIAKDCQPVIGPRPGFETAKACDAYADEVIRKADDLHVMAVCAKQHEA